MGPRKPDSTRDHGAAVPFLGLGDDVGVTCYLPENVASTEIEVRAGQ